MTQFCSVICTLLSLMHDCIHIYMGVQKGQNYPKLVNTMKAHTCNKKRSQKTFEPRANKPNLHKSKCHTHNTKHKSKCHTQWHKKVELSSWGVRQISMLIYLGRKNLHTFPYFVYGGRVECCDLHVTEDRNLAASSPVACYQIIN
jgi:hypothetical protein